MPPRKLVANNQDVDSAWFINRLRIERAQLPDPEVVAKLPARAPFTHHPDRAPRMLDLFCGAGGTGVGYWLSGFDVIGVDKYLQPNYPFPFFHADAMTVLRAPRFVNQFDVIHLSPPCPVHSKLSSLNSNGDGHDPTLIPQIQELVKRYDKPYVLENVEGAPLAHPIKLCGSMFGLQVQRHRLFESNVRLVQPQCNHDIWIRWFPAQVSMRSDKPARTVGVYGRGSATNGMFNVTDLWRWASQIPWVTNRKEVADAIPPAYTEFIGWQLMNHLYGDKGMYTSEQKERV